MRSTIRVFAVALSATALTVAIALPVCAQSIDHFTCYKAKTAQGTPKFTAVPGVSLVDKFGTSTVEVKKPRLLCAPTNKNGEDPSAPSHPDHLTGYQTKSRIQFVRPGTQRVVDQFGTHFFDVHKPLSLHVPTAKSRTSPPPAPNNPPLDHFRCYRVRTPAGTPRFTYVTGVTIQDQFGTMTIDVRKPRRLCLPVDKNGETPDADNHPGHLMCYQIKQRSTPRFPGARPLYTNNQFGPLTLDARKPAELCVPALRVPVGATPTATAAIATPTLTPTPFATPTIPPLCGNGSVDAGEQCDGAAPSACPGSCTPFCQCPACGDNIVNQPTEECDGLAAPGCPGTCGSDCLCPVVCDFLDPSVCLHPFPNDYFTVVDASTVTGRRLNLQLTAMPRNASQKPIEPADYNRNDGFSPGPLITLKVPGVDLAMTGAVPVTDVERSFDPAQPIVLINATTGQRHLIWSELDAIAASDDDRTLIIRPAVNLEYATRYIVALRNMKDAAGAVIAPNADFLAYRDSLPTGNPAKEARRAHMEDIFATLTTAGIARGDLYLAWDFTVGSSESITGRLLFMRDDAFASLAGGAPTYVVTQVQNEVDAKIFRRVSGYYFVPRYVNSPGPGARFTLDANNLPIRQATDQQASFICNIPRSALANATATAVPGRPLVHGHGLFGDASTVNAANVTDFANEHNLPSCATDWLGMSTQDLPTVIGTVTTDLSNFPMIPDRVQQAVLNTLFLARLWIHPDGFIADPNFQDLLGNPVVDPSHVFYDGNSQGGILGGLFMSVSQDVTRGVLGVPAINFSTLLTRSVDFDVFAITTYQAYPNELERSLIFSLLQTLWDRGEPNGYARRMTSNPLPNTPPHEVLLHEAFGDHQVTNVATEVEARTIGARIYQPALVPGRHSDVNPYFGIPAIPGFPASGSALIVWDTCTDDNPANGMIEPATECDTPTPPTTNEPNRGGSDPHGRPRADACGRRQKSEFLRVTGAVTDACNGQPCQANNTPFPCPAP